MAPPRQYSKSLRSPILLLCLTVLVSLLAVLSWFFPWDAPEVGQRKGHLLLAGWYFITWTMAAVAALGLGAIILRWARRTRLAALLAIPLPFIGVVQSMVYLVSASYGQRGVQEMDVLPLFIFAVLMTGSLSAIRMRYLFQMERFADAQVAD